MSEEGGWLPVRRCCICGRYFMTEKEYHDHWVLDHE